MDFVVLVAPFLIIFTALLGLVFILFKKIWVGLSLIFVAIAFDFHTESLPINLSFEKGRGDLRVLTYNMYSSSDYYTSVEDNPADVVAMLLDDDPDVIILEEYYPDHCNALRDSLLKYYDYFEFQQDYTYCSNAVFSRFPLSDWSEMKIVEEEDAFDDYLMRRAREIDGLRTSVPDRSVSSVWLHLPQDSVRLIACHLSSNHFDQAREAFADSISLQEKVRTVLACFEAGQLERKVEVKRIMEQVESLKRQGKETIVLGDMNDVAGSRTLRAFSRGGLLKNGWWERGFGPGLTFHAHKIMHFRLDHVLHTTGLHLRRIWIRDEEYSDHQPVLADFDL